MVSVLVLRCVAVPLTSLLTSPWPFLQAGWQYFEAHGQAIIRVSLARKLGLTIAHRYL